MSAALEVPPRPLAAPVRARESAGDRAFRRAAFCAAAVVLALAAGIALELAWNSRQAWSRYGLPFFWTSVWDPVAEEFGAWPFLFGTLYSSFLALAISVPLGVGAAIFLTELAPRRLADAATFLIELLAAVPSVVLGLMGIFVLVPAVRAVEPALGRWLGWLPFFEGPAYGVGMLSAALVLSVMVLPYITSITRDILLGVPGPLKEAMLALGATRWEVVSKVSLPFARSGILGAVFLALGRALGETMAVTMVIGNDPKASWSLFAPAYTMSAVLANEFAEASSDLYLHALVAIGLALFAVTIVINGLARLLIRPPSRGAA
ncbi:MAG: phosphate ABC transporter permease subunit PstC [Elusimicrobia bacterium]|nr:phosphate ABC transporter permease subunit PstC [Elusimicrobiota bacterium]